MNDSFFWQAKVLAFLHDPVEKALVLFRGKGHEAGTVAAMKELLGADLARVYESGQEAESLVKKADRWAAAADRPSLPMNLGRGVVFADDPQIIHPLSGRLFRLRELATEAQAEVIEALSFEHFQRLVVWEDTEKTRPDWRRTFLSLWRFGPETPAKGMGALWNLLPADTRSPDHTIWEHLKLTSAFAGALAAGSGGPALLLVSFGPVQGFISQARSVSDLWAASHLLSRIAWEGMRILCDRFGPDSVLFPDLHGVAIADLWLREQLGGEWKGNKPEWMNVPDDTNPLFAAALPNRFVALVPSAQARDVAQEVTRKVGSWVRARAGDALEEILRAAEREAAPYAQVQLNRQFKEFPEVNWAVVPWNLAGTEKLEDGQLKGLLNRLGADPLYLPEDLNGLVRGEITVAGHPFFSPNPGVGYPGLFESLERLHASAKNARPFGGDAERGYRCTLCGEREWLTDDEGLLHESLRDREKRSLWTAVAKNRPALAKAGEHLCGICVLKRAWPRLFVREAAASVRELERIDRFVLSTRSVALSTSLWRWLDQEKSGWPGEMPEDGKRRLKAEKDLKERLEQEKEIQGVAIPRRLYGRIMVERPKDKDLLKRLPALLDLEPKTKDEEKGIERRMMAIHSQVTDFLGVKPEAYYAFVLMDGDNMGAWLAGEMGRGEEWHRMGRRFHAQTLESLNRTGAFGAFLEADRPASPSRHQTISSALNGFALHLARVVVEDLFLGKLIYAGGDDLMAMVAVHDLPGLMLALRCTYSGVLPKGSNHEGFWKRLTGQSQERLKIRNGFALLRNKDKDDTGRMFRLMGERATASAGAVVAHHSAPMSRVLSELRAAEKAAKGAGRDAFCITIDKRAGGMLDFIGGWRLKAGLENGDIGLLMELRNLFADPKHGMSRRAAYLLAESLRDVPPHKETLALVLAHQFNRQARSDSPGVKEARKQFAERLAGAAVSQRHDAETDFSFAPSRWLKNLVLTAEFLAREGRAATQPSSMGEDHV